MLNEERILTALDLGAMTADQLIKRLSLSEGIVRRLLNKLRTEGKVRVTRAAREHQLGASPRLYSRATSGLVELGRVKHDNAIVTARLVGDILTEAGEVAVFIGPNHAGAVAMHYDPGYADALDRHVTNLVGRYRSGEGSRFSAKAVAADIRARLAEVSKEASHVSKAA